MLGTLTVMKPNDVVQRQESTGEVRRGLSAATTGKAADSCLRTGRPIRKNNPRVLAAFVDRERWLLERRIGESANRDAYETRQRAIRVVHR